MESANISDDRKRRVPAPTMGTDDDLSAPAEVEIARLACSYWEARGEKGGSPWEDWDRAEEELMRSREL